MHQENGIQYILTDNMIFMYKFQSTCGGGDKFTGYNNQLFDNKYLN